MRMVLFRHGIAAELMEMRAPSARDVDRPLTAEGARKVRKAGRALRSLGIRPDLLLHSGLVRARETAELLAVHLRPREPRLLVADALEPDADPIRVLERVARLKVRSLVAVGHAPNLDRVIALACGIVGPPLTELGKAGAACLDLPDPGRSPGRLVWLLPPKLLRRLAAG